MKELGLFAEFGISTTIGHGGFAGLYDFFFIAYDRSIAAGSLGNAV